ncbi:MAG: radical SAM protein [Gammaproteobacteria bacterium]|nr:radical SAM protein [Gammaproteobacteria bacterium]MDH5692133.1 radical SAM protein [Gammaproteobacteria bacterium]
MSLAADRPRPQRNVYAKTPKYVEIETTIMCNAKCWFCPQKNTLRQPKYMEDWLWKKIIDDTRDIGAIYRPFLLNEPFADKRMPEIVRYMKKDPTAQVEFNTNGSMLTQKVADQILDSGVNVMRFSIDGFRKETFDESRGISYDKVYKHVRYFLEQVKSSGAPIHTEVRMIKLPGTEEEQKEFKAYWEQYSPDNIVFTSLYSYPWEGQTESTNLPCVKVKDEMFFYVDGTCTLCCWDSIGRQIVGDAKTENVLDIWNGQEMARCRELLDAGRRDQLELCKRCDAYAHYDFSNWEGFDAKAAAAHKEKTIPVNIVEIT